MYHGQLESGEIKMLRRTDKFPRIFKVMIQIASAVEIHYSKHFTKPSQNNWWRLRFISSLKML